MDIIKRLDEAKAPYQTSKIYEEARAHNAMLDAMVAIERLSAALDIARIALLNIERRSEEGRAELSAVFSHQQCAGDRK